MTTVGPDSSKGLRIAPQGGYLAKRCPEAVQLDVLRPLEPLPSSEFMTMLAEGGISFESEVFEALRSAIAGSVEVDRSLDRPQREQRTAAAMGEGATLVIGGRLPVDAAGLRVGEPDLLVRVGDRPKPDGRWAYVAVDVKHHIVRDGADEHTANAVTSLSTAPWVETGGAHTSAAARCNQGDLLQLAHYQRLLEAGGHEATEGRWGGIVGVGQLLAWYDLDAPRWDWSEYLDERVVGSLSTMETYDSAFAHRLAVLEAAQRHRQDPTVPLLAEPVAISACPECGWRVWCYPILEQTADLSLLPGMSLHKRRLHHDRGVADLHGLARLDERTARVLTGGVNVADLLERAAEVDRDTPIAQIIPRRRRQISDLAEEDIHVAGDLDRILGATFAYRDAAMGDLPAQIDRARARLGALPAYRDRGVDELEVPRADVEIDVDMESAALGTYLWGVLVQKRDQEPGRGPDYLAFVSWDPSAFTGELDAFARFWTWLRDRREDAQRLGRSVRVYCYNKGAEGTHMRRIATRLGLEDEVEAFLTSDDWVDLMAVVREQLVTGTAMGLKTVAKLAGFQWRGEDGGGGLAMVRYAEAVDDPDAEVRAAARRWILEYNEDDVRATAALRHWLDTDARQLPSVADLSP
ncbi:MAG TPA: TM0106 family RecB-like putative nuclease [Acidimicrobiales bacterium]